MAPPLSAGLTISSSFLCKDVSDSRCSCERLSCSRVVLWFVFVLMSRSTSEMYSKRFMLSGIGGVKLFVVLNGCLYVLLVSLKKYLRYIFRRYCRKDWYIVLLCVRLGLGINFNPLDSAPIVVAESSVSDRLTMLLMLELWRMLL